MTSEKNVTAQVFHRFSHSAERVFDAWLDARKVRQFMFTAGSGELVHCEIDPRVGGEFVMTDRRAEGDVEHRGRYLEIARPHKLVFVYGIPAESQSYDRVTVEIKPVEGGCELTVTHEMGQEWVAYVDSARKGWGEILNTLSKVLGK